jgi:hypothetical protein
MRRRGEERRRIRRRERRRGNENRTHCYQERSLRVFSPPCERNESNGQGKFPCLYGSEFITSKCTVLCLLNAVGSK